MAIYTQEQYAAQRAATDAQAAAAKAKRAAAKGINVGASGKSISPDASTTTSTVQTAPNGISKSTGVAPSSTDNTTGTPASTMTGGINQEGSPNPYTGGNEVNNPAGTQYGVNEGPYSPSNKQAMWNKAGRTGTYDTNAFYRGTNGELLMKPQTATSTPNSSATSVSATPTTTNTSTTPNVVNNTTESTLASSASTAAQDAAKQEQANIAASKDNAANAQQINDQILSRTAQSAEDYAKGKEALANAQIADATASEQRQQAEYTRQMNVAMEEMKPLEEQKIAQLQADKTKADADAQIAIQEAKEAAETLQIQNSVNWGSAAGATSAGFVAAMQRSSDASARGIAKLKIDAGYQSVSLQTKISEAEFNMVHKINSIISTANQASITSEKEFKEKVNTIQGNILLTRKEKDENISKAQQDYINNKIKIQDNMASSVRTANSEIQKNLLNAKKYMEEAKASGQKKVDELVMDGQWDKLSSTDKETYARQSGKSIQGIESNKNSTIYTAVNKGLQAYFGEGVMISPGSMSKVFNYAQSLVATGMSPNQAILQSVMTIGANLPEKAEYERQKSLKERQMTAETLLREAQADSASTEASVAEQTASSRIKSLERQYSAKNEYAFTPNSDGTILVTNKDTGDSYIRKPTKDLSPAQWSTETGVSALDIPEGVVYTNTRTGAKTLQCGEFANNVTGKIPVGDTYAARKAGFTDSTPKVGGQVFMDSGDREHGHVAVVTGVNADGTFTVKEANKDGTGKATVRTLSTKDVNGFYNNTDLAKKAENAGIKDDVYKLNAIQGVSENSLIASVPTSANATQAELKTLAKSTISQYGNSPEATQKFKEEAAKQGIINPFDSWTTEQKKDWGAQTEEYRFGKAEEKGAEFANAIKRGGITPAIALQQIKSMFPSEGDTTVKEVTDDNGNIIGVSLRYDPAWLGDETKTISFK